MEDARAARRRRQLARLAADRLSSWRSIHAAACAACQRRGRRTWAACRQEAVLWRGRGEYRADDPARAAFDQGWDAFVAGVDPSHNPHPVAHGDRHWGWNAGWGWAQLAERDLGRRPFPVSDEILQAGLGGRLPPGLGTDGPA